MDGTGSGPIQSGSMPDTLQISEEWPHTFWEMCDVCVPPFRYLKSDTTAIERGHPSGTFVEFKGIRRVGIPRLQASRNHCMSTIPTFHWSSLGPYDSQAETRDFGQ